MTLTMKLVLSAAALAFTAGAANAECSYSKKMTMASTVEEQKPVDVAALAAPEAPAGTVIKKPLLPAEPVVE